MNAPELREAFDAVAKDLFRNETDIDLPPGDEAFYKALRRAEAFTVFGGTTRTKRDGKMSG